MGYIMDLRAFVGHRPLIQVGATVIVEDGQGRILLQLRKDNHTWECSAADGLGEIPARLRAGGLILLIISGQTP